MKVPSKKIIHEIAQELDCGNNCYYNFNTGELISIPSANLFASGDTEYHMQFFKEDFNNIKEQKQNLIKFEVLSSYESYRIMEKFTLQISDEDFKEKLDSALNRKGPFRNFKQLIDSSEYREEWFLYKQKEIEHLVSDILEQKIGF